MSVAQDGGFTLWLFVLVCGIVKVPGAALGQAIPRDEYLHYVPLKYPTLPMDFRRFIDQSQSSNLHVDTWSLLGSPKELVRSDMVNLNTMVEEPCDSTSAEAHRYGPSGDCLLMDLLDHDPDLQPIRDSAEFVSLMKSESDPLVAVSTHQGNERDICWELTSRK